MINMFQVNKCGKKCRWYQTGYLCVEISTSALEKAVLTLQGQGNSEALVAENHSCTV